MHLTFCGFPNIIIVCPKGIADYGNRVPGWDVKMVCYFGTVKGLAKMSVTRIISPSENLIANLGIQILTIEANY